MTDHFKFNNNVFFECGEKIGLQHYKNARITNGRIDISINNYSDASNNNIYIFFTNKTGDSFPGIYNIVNSCNLRNIGETNALTGNVTTNPGKNFTIDLQNRSEDNSNTYGTPEDAEHTSNIDYVVFYNHPNLKINGEDLFIFNSEHFNNFSFNDTSSNYYFFHQSKGGDKSKLVALYTKSDVSGSSESKTIKRSYKYDDEYIYDDVNTINSSINWIGIHKGINNFMFNNKPIIKLGSGFSNLNGYFDISHNLNTSNYYVLLSPVVFSQIDNATSFKLLIKNKTSTNFTGYAYRLGDSAHTSPETSGKAEYIYFRYAIIRTDT